MYAALSTGMSVSFGWWEQWLPESARYDMLTGNQEKALATLKRIATENGAPMPLGKLIAARQVKVCFSRTQILCIVHVCSLLCCHLYIIFVLLIRRIVERFETCFHRTFAGPQFCCGLFGKWSE